MVGGRGTAPGNNVFFPSIEWETHFSWASTGSLHGYGHPIRKIVLRDNHGWNCGGLRRTSSIGDTPPPPGIHKSLQARMHTISFLKFGYPPPYRCHVDDGSRHIIEVVCSISQHGGLEKQKFGLAFQVQPCLNWIPGKQSWETEGKRCNINHITPPPFPPLPEFRLFYKILPTAQYAQWREKGSLLNLLLSFVPSRKPWQTAGRIIA